MRFHVYVAEMGHAVFDIEDPDNPDWEAIEDRAEDQIPEAAETATEALQEALLLNGHYFSTLDFPVLVLLNRKLSDAAEKAFQEEPFRGEPSSPEYEGDGEDAHASSEAWDEATLNYWVARSEPD